MAASVDDVRQNLPPGLVEALGAAEHIVVLTGAGVSAESGIPTFREAQTGLWARYEPTELATRAAFRAQPQRVWSWYAWRRELVAGCRPNPGHYALAYMQAQAPRFTLLTQNIDGLHTEAGSNDVVELHGNIHRYKCLDRDHEATKAPAGDGPPPCPLCGSPLRPDVVWFGEQLPERALRRAIQAAEDADIFLSVGTSAVVYPAAELPLVTLRRGRPVAEVNPEATPLTRYVTYHLPHPSGIALPALAETVWPGFTAPRSA